jgi:hypothetical protein
MVPRVYYIEPALAVHRQMVRPPTVEMTKVAARASAADGAHVLEVAVEDLDAVVALVGDVDSAVAVHRHVKGIVEMAVV